MNLPIPIHTETVDRLRVNVYSGRRDLGVAAGADIAEKMRSLLAAKPGIRMIFAAAPSQNETLAALSTAPGIDWSRVTAFHMDEYLNLAPDAPQRFSRFVKTHLFDKVNPRVVHLIDSSKSAADECRRYGDLLHKGPIDIVCLGIGENGHIAFNDPPVANFNDPETIKVVELDDNCRHQQVNDGCFSSFTAVPTHALTLTIPMLLSGKHLFCMVPGPTKRHAVEATLKGMIATNCPSTILRNHADCTLYVDRDSYGMYMDRDSYGVHMNGDPFGV